MVATAKKDFPNFCTLPKIRKVFSAAIFRSLLYTTLALPTPIDFPHSSLAAKFCPLKRLYSQGR